MKTLKKIVSLLCGLMLIGFVSACEQEGPAEKAGEKVDQAVEESQEAMEEAGEESQDAAEQAGESVEEAGEEMQQ